MSNPAPSSVTLIRSSGGSATDERLHHQPVQVLLDHRVELNPIRRRLHGHGNLGAGGDRGRLLAQRGDQALLGQRTGPELEDQGPHLR
jgi:hypothetical protein